MILSMAMAMKNFQIQAILLVNMLMENLKEWAHIIMLTAKSTKDNGLVVWSMVMEFGEELKMILILVNGYIINLNILIIII